SAEDAAPEEAPAEEPAPEAEAEPEIEAEPETEEAGSGAEDAGPEAAPSGDDMSEDEIADLLGVIPELGEGEAPAEGDTVPDALDDLLPDAAEAAPEEDLLAGVSGSDDKDVTEIIDEIPQDDELSEISDLLKKNDSNEMVDDELMSMLGVAEESGAVDELADLSAADKAAEEAPEEKKKKKKKGGLLGGLFSLFGKKKDGEDEEESEEDGEEEKPKRAKKAGKAEAAGEALDMPPLEEDGIIVDSMDLEGGGTEVVTDAEEKKPSRGGGGGSLGGDDGEDGEKKEKKPGFFKRLLGALFESSDDDEDDETGGHSEATLENMQVIKEAEEEEGKKKKKKEKKPKPKKEKKPKPKKPKKEKKPADDGPPEKKIPRKKIIAVFIFFASLTAMIIFCLSVFPKAGFVKQGKEEYQRGQYDDAFRSMAGVRGLDEESQQIFDNTVTIMTLDRKYESYDDYAKQGKNLEALNSLIEGVAYYNDHIEEARANGIDGPLTEEYQRIIGILKDEYGIGEERATDLSNIADRTTYTVALMDIADPEWRDRVRQEIINDELASIGVDVRSNAEKNKQRVVSTSVEAYDPRAIPKESAEETVDEPEGDVAADTGETPESPEVNDSGDEETPQEPAEEEPRDEGGDTSGEGDLLYEFNVSRQDDGTYSSR
ncbi:MAG: hypothetical protein IJ857_03395, partial [Lachnospiraceae bacterium]|nr:hypothetical protein [Lachnospiraceae bacterium]